MPQAETELNAQEAHISKLPMSLSDDYRKRMGELLELKPEQIDRIKKWLKEQLKNWESDTKDLHQRLQDDNDLVEGIIMETDFPWVGASNVHDPLTEIYMDSSRSVEKRSILGAGLLWVCETDNDDLREVAAKVEEMMNYNARNKWNIERQIPSLIWTANRDGLGIAQVPYVEEYEKTNDILVITSKDEFLAEFPTADDAGGSQDEYDQMLEMCANATEEDPVEIPITFEKQTYAGPKVEIVELVDFVTIPAWVPDIKDARCRGYGKRYPCHIETIREKGQNEVWYSDAAQRVIDKGKGSSATAYEQAKDDILGIKRTSAKDERTLFELVIKGRLEDDGETEKLMVTYSLQDDELLQAINYVYRVDFYALFRTDERPNQLVGKSLPSKTRDFNDLSDTLINQTVNANTISTVPMFKGQADMKDELDMDLIQNKIKPGGILWLSNFDAFTQFTVQPTDHGENLALSERAMRVLDMYVGMPASLFAGGVPTGDPQAPGNKTAALITQGNLRMEDPIQTFRYGMDDLGNICLSHVYQFGAPILSWQSEQSAPDGQINKKVNTLHKKYLRKDLQMKMNGVSVIDNPDAEMNKAFQLHTILMSTKDYAESPDLQNELLRDALQKGRVSGRDRYLPNSQAIQEKMMAMQKMAMTQMVAEKAAQEQAAQEAQVKANLAKAVQDLKIKDTAQRMAESNLNTEVAA